jgi:hypothetical protein
LSNVVVDVFVRCVAEAARPMETSAAIAIVSLPANTHETPSLD